MKTRSKITARNERFFKQDLSGLSGFSKKKRSNHSNRSNLAGKPLKLLIPLSGISTRRAGRHIADATSSNNGGPTTSRSRRAASFLKNTERARRLGSDGNQNQTKENARKNPDILDGGLKKREASSSNTVE